MKAIDRPAPAGVVIDLRPDRPEWCEITVSRILGQSKRSKYFQEMIEDAKQIFEEGYAWDVALIRSFNHWILP